VDFNLQTASPLKIAYDVFDKKSSADANEYRAQKEWMKSVKASSTKNGYPLANLFDGKWETAWVEGATGPGVNEWIEVEMDSVIRFMGIILINGYAKSEQTYYANNRIKELKVEIEHPKREYGGNETLVVELEDLPYQTIDIHTFMKMASIVYDGGDGGRDYFKFKLTILDVYKGTTYDDTCLSELLVLGRRLVSGEYEY
jgi:hypothetical protein